MYNKTKVTDSFYGLVGFQNPINPNYAIVDANNQLSRSGRFATENPYCKIEYLKETQDYIEASDAQFNTFLEGLQRRSIAEIMDKVLIKPDYIDRQVLYQFPNNKVKTDELPSTSFVGYRITKSLDKNVAFEIPRIFLEFEGAGDITLVLFNSAIKSPVESKTITISSAQQSESLGWRVDNTGDYFQGEWYLGYFSDSVTGTLKPIDRDYENANVMSYITHMNFERGSFPNVTLNELPDLEDWESSDEVWGLNPDIIVYNDYTDLIIQHEALFAPAIQLQMVINSIQEYISSLRSNRSQQISEEQLNLIIAQLEGIPDRITGLIPTLHKEVRSLNKEIEKLTNGMFTTGFILNTLS